MMPTGKASGNAVLAKARALYGSRLRADDYRRLMACRTMTELAAALKEYPLYSEALAEVNPQYARRVQLENLLRQSLYTRYDSLCRYDRSAGSKVYEYFTLCCEVDELTAAMRCLDAGRPGDYLFRLPEFLQQRCCIDLYALAKATSLDGILAAVAGTRWEKVLAPLQSAKPDRGLTNYFAWPIFNRLSKSDIAEFKYDRVEIVKTEIPKGVGEEDKGKFFEPTTPSKMFLWANSLSIMRKEMEENVNARIVLGGKIVNFKGRMAGIFEEAICAIQKKHPIYLLGGFGGASAQIVKLMKGETTAEKLFEEAKTNEDYKKLIEYCQMSCLPTINYDELKKFENKDYQVLRNGLDKDENEILFNSINIPEIISLILKGINKAFNY